MVRPRNDGMLATCTMISVPLSCDGSTSALSRCSATIGATSLPCVPPISASVGPDCAPRMTEIGIRVPLSPRAAISMNPDALLPGRASTFASRVGPHVWAPAVAERIRDSANDRIFALECCGLLPPPASRLPPPASLRDAVLHRGDHQLREPIDF